MVIRYADGREVEALILSRTEDRLRVLARGSEDAEEFWQVHGTWVGETCEPVQIEFRWKQRQRPVAEEDCICSKELAGCLIQLLCTGSDQPGAVGMLHEATTTLSDQPYATALS